MTKQELKEEVMREFDDFYSDLNQKLGIKEYRTFISQVIDRTAEETFKAVIGEEVCGICGGSGEFGDIKCDGCNGTGMIESPYSVFRYNEFNK